MKRQVYGHQISVSLTHNVQLEMRELKMLRQMAQHCRETMMRGCAACERLDKMLADMGVETYDDADGPVYDVFK